MKKRVVHVVLALCAVLCLSACGAEGDGAGMASNGVGVIEITE